MTERLEIDLTPERYEMVQHAVEDGRYESPSAVVDEALALLEQQQRDREVAIEIKELVAEAEASGYEPWEGAEALKQELRGRHAHLTKS